MIKIEETQNFVTLTCTHVNADTIDKVHTILEDFNINSLDLRDFQIDTWTHNVYDSDSSYRHHGRIDYRDPHFHWEEYVTNAIEMCKDLKDPEITITLLFKKPDPMKSVIDNVNKNLRTLNTKMETEL